MRLYTTAGDRRDRDMIRQGELLGDAFDRVILYEDHYLRGRPEGEIIALIRRGVQSGSRVRQIEEIRGADAAVELALHTAQPGDLVLVQADTVDETIQFIRRYLESVAEPALDETPAAAGKNAALAKVEEAQRKAAAADTIAAGAVAASPSVAKV